MSTIPESAPTGGSDAGAAMQPAVDSHGESPDYRGTGQGGKEHLTFSRWRVARAGAVGASTGFILAWGLSDPGSLLFKPGHEQVLFAIAGVIMVIIGVSVVEPFMDWMHHGDTGAHGHSQPLWKQVRMTAVVVGLAFVFGVVEGLFHETLVESFEIILTWFVTLLGGWVVTYAWLRGAYRGPPRATVNGILAGVLYSLTVVLIFFVMILVEVSRHAGGITVSELFHRLGVATRGGIAGIFAWGLCGLLGGIALDYFRRPAPVVRLILAIVLAWLIVLSATLPLLDEPRTWIVDLARALGWGVGLLLYRPGHLAFAHQRTPIAVSVRAARAAIAFTAIVVVAAVCGVYGMSRTLEQEDQYVFKGVIPDGDHDGHGAAVVRLSELGHGRFIVTLAHNVGEAEGNVDDFTIRLWEREGGEEYRRLVGHKGEVLDAMAADAYEEELVSFGADKYLMKWDVARGIEVESEAVELPMVLVEHARFLRGSHRLLISNRIGAVVIYDWEAKKEVRVFEKTIEGVVDAEWVDEGHFAAVGMGGQIAIFSVDDGSEQVLGQNPFSVSCAAVSANHRYLAVGNYVGGIAIWDVRERRVVRTLTKQADGISLLAINNDAELALFVTAGNTLHVWNVARDAEIWHGENPARPTMVQFMPYRHFASGGVDGKVNIWRAPH